MCWGLHVQLTHTIAELYSLLFTSTFHQIEAISVSNQELMKIWFSTHGGKVPYLMLST